jgi:hypothetical protein
MKRFKKMFTCCMPTDKEVSEITMIQEYKTENKTCLFDDILLPAKILRVVDGDTVNALIVTTISGQTKVVEQMIRLSNINTKELRSKIYSERILAKKAKKVLEHILDSNKNWCIIKCFGTDNFGRVIGTIYTLDKMNINNYLLIRSDLQTGNLQYNLRYFELTTDDENKIHELRKIIMTIYNNPSEMSLAEQPLL